MSSKKHNKGTKMTLAQFANLNLSDKNPTPKIFPVIEEPVERAPVVSFSEIMKNQKEAKSSIEDNQDDTYTENKQSSSMKKGRVNFKKGQKMDLNHPSFASQILDTDRPYSNDLDLRSLREQKFRQDEENKRQLEEDRIEREVSLRRWEDSSKRNNFVPGEVKQYSTDMYHDFVAARHATMKEPGQFSTLGDMSFYLFQAPGMMRDIMMIDILKHGINVVSRIDKNLKLTSTMNSNDSIWKNAMSARNALFNMSKNGKEIVCDVRPTFHPSMMEVQICKFTANGNFD